MEEGLLDSVRLGDRKALARAISLVEQGETWPLTSEKRPHVLGVTGPPGAGKSTLISAMVGRMRSRGETVAILAVDPSSPITGGALLGDRVRMQGHVGDAGVFIRSMATRGHLGGLASAAGAALDLMGLAGFDRLIVETVGVGQSEVEVMHVADHVLLVIGPSWGDEIQAEKAGVIEIADLIVVNKADRPEADEVRRALIRARGDEEVLLASALTGAGVEELLAAVDSLPGP